MTSGCRLSAILKSRKRMSYREPLGTRESSRPNHPPISPIPTSPFLMRVAPHGVNRTDWCPFDKGAYDACIDPRDYRPKP
jgi:hypothetical protein